MVWGVGQPGGAVSLTGEVDGVQADSSGSDEASDPLQLPLSHIVLEDDVIGEVHAADRLRSGRTLAAGQDVTFLGVRLDLHRLGNGALVILHPGQI